MSAGGVGGCGDECEGEDAEDSSSRSLANLSLQNQNVEPQELKGDDALASFRQQWQRELASSPQRQLNRQEINNQVETIEQQAKRLFVLGTVSERRGALDEAVVCYRRALQLVPDIERRLHEIGTAQTQESSEYNSEDEIEDTALREGDVADEEDEDLLARFQRLVALEGMFCKPEVESRGAHISQLPVEVLMLVLRWVVGAQLDAVSLCRAGAVSRGLYLASREPEIWRTLCVRTWGMNCGTLKGTPWSSWRQMYIERTRLRFHGCYISKTSYLRHGENSFQDTFYKPWYLVQYYRYLRFFPNGEVLMLTTAEEPAACVPILRQNCRSDQPVLSGHYRLVVDKVLIVVKKQSAEKKPVQASNTRFRSRRVQQPDQSQQTFHLELQVCAHKSRRNAQLQWVGYKVTTRNKSGTESSSTFELSGPRFPPFWFSMVRSYSAESESPLV